MAALATGMAVLVAGCASDGAGVRLDRATTAAGREAGDVRASAPPAAHGAERRTTVAPEVGDTADPLLAATAAYLSSPAGRADAWLLTYAGDHPPDRYWDAPGGCAAWFAGAAPPEGGGGLLAGDPPAAPAFGGYVSALRMARLDLVLRRVRCGSDPGPGSLPEKLEQARAGWRSLVAYAEDHGLAVPDPDPPAPVLPPPPLLLTGEGSRTVLVEPPTARAGEPFLLTVVAGGPGLRLTTLGPTGEQESLAGHGTHIVDRAGGHRTSAVRVEGEGPWQLRLQSFALMRTGTLPGTVHGRGNDVVLVDVSMLGTARAAIVDGVADVVVHRSQQEPQPLAGRMPEADVVVLEVHAGGPWTIRTP